MDQILESGNGKKTRRVRALGISGVNTNPQLIAYLIRKNGDLCQICNKPIENKTGPWSPSVDHIIPLAKGGTHTPDNIQLTHKLCNNRKGDKWDLLSVEQEQTCAEQARV